MFIITLKQVSLLLFYILLGYFLRRKNITGEQTGSILSKLLTYVFLPAYYVCSLSKNMTIEMISTYLSLILLGIVSVIFVLILATFLCKIFSKDEGVRNMFKYMIMFSNVGYFGYPLVEGVFGLEYLTMFMIYVLPITMVINSYGYYILTKPTKEELLSADGLNAPKKSMISSIFSVPMIASFVGLALGLIPYDVPSVIYDFLTPAANCMSACAMIISGSVLAKLPLKKLFLSGKGYLLSAIRLVGFPIVIGGLLYLLGVRGIYFVCLVVFLSLPAGMNVIVYSEAAGRDSIEGAKACFISYVVALATIPLVFMLMKALLGTV